MKPPVQAPWFQPKSKGQLFAVVGILLAIIAGAWIYGLSYLKKITAAAPAPVIQKARNLLEERKYDEAVGTLLPVIQEIERTRGPEDTSLVKHCDLLASVYEAMKKDAEAEPMWRKSFDIRRKNLGPDHPESIGSGDKLGMCLVAQGKYAEAETLLKKSLAHREAYYGADNEGILVSLNHLAELSLAQKKWAEAESYAGRAVKIGRSKIGLMPAGMPEAQHLLGKALAGLEKYEDALPLYDAALKYKVRLLPEAPHIPPKAGQISHGDFSDLCKEYAAVLRKAGKEKEAKELDAKAESVLKPKE